jgi:type IV secretion system protein TrbL
MIQALWVSARATPGMSGSRGYARGFRWFLWMVLVGSGLYLLVIHPVRAATSIPIDGVTVNFTLFDSIDQDANQQSVGWFNTIQALVRPTFLILATIEICWAAALWAFEKDNLNSLAVEIIKKIMFIGFFYALLQFAPEWIPSITDTFQQVGETAANTGTLSTDKIFATGLAIIKFIWDKVPHVTITNVWGLIGKFIVAAFVSVGIIIAYVVLAAQYFTLKIESYVLFAAGAIFLGLGSSSWTKEYVSKYLNYAINVGVRLLVLILVISLMLNAIQQMGSAFSFDYLPLLQIMAVCLLQMILGIKAPEMAGSLLNGGAGLSAGAAKSAVGSAVGGLNVARNTATSVANAAKSGAGTAAGGAQGLSNLGKAVSAGTELAQQQGKTGAAATLSGLGAAVRQTARELPGSVMNVLKSKGTGSGLGGFNGGSMRGQNPGPLDRAQQNLQNLAAAGAGQRPGGGGGAAGSAPGASNSSSLATPGGSLHDTAKAMNRGTGSSSRPGGDSSHDSAGTTSSPGTDLSNLGSGVPGAAGLSSDTGAGSGGSADSGSQSDRPPPYEVGSWQSGSQTAANLEQASADSGIGSAPNRGRSVKERPSRSQLTVQNPNGGGDNSDSTSGPAALRKATVKSPGSI